MPAPVAGDSLTVRVAVGPLADSVPALSEVLLVLFSIVDSLLFEIH